MAFVDLFNPESIIQYGGLTLLLLIIFAETGLFAGFFLPGDSLLFIAGVLCQNKQLDISLWLLIVLIILAAVTGSATGYWFGKWADDYLQKRKENFFYRRKYLDMTREFYKKYGMMAFVAGRFLPIFRTFIPILAGMVKIGIREFMIYNILGAVIWVTSLVTAGYWAGKKFPFLSEHMEIIVLGMILLTSVAVILSILKNQTKASDQTP